MAKMTLVQIPEKLYAILAPLTAEERSRAVQATLILFGDDGVSVSVLGTRSMQVPTGAGAFLDEKEPKNKGEILAVAARYRELTEVEESHSKADLKKIITDARRNFDDNNFTRDINNAKRQAGFFNIGTGRNSHKLSYYGQQFVDALPDREAAGKLKKPKVDGRKKAAGSSRSTKKAED